MIINIQVQIEDEKVTEFFEGLALENSKTEDEDNFQLIDRLVKNAVVGSAKDGMRKLAAKMASEALTLPEVTVSTSLGE